MVSAVVTSIALEGLRNGRGSLLALLFLLILPEIATPPALTKASFFDLIRRNRVTLSGEMGSDRGIVIGGSVEELRNRVKH